MNIIKLNINQQVNKYEKIYKKLAYISYQTIFKINISLKITKLKIEKRGMKNDNTKKLK